MNKRTKNLLLNVEFSRDLLPHLKEPTCNRALYWCGPFDKRNQAPIGDTAYGMRFPPTTLLLLYYEIGKRTHVDALSVAAAFTAPSGTLQKAGSVLSLHPRDVSPWRRTFGRLTKQAPNYGLPIMRDGFSKQTTDLLRQIRNGCARLRKALASEGISWDELCERSNRA